MKKRGKNLKIYLMDGEASGRWTCELSNWNGKAYRFSKLQLKNCKDIDELLKPAVYLLFGYNEETDKQIVYIGETDKGIERLGQHLSDSDKDWWNDTVVFVSQGDNLNKAFVKYLEHVLYKKAYAAGRFELANINEPTKSKISLSDSDELDEFADNIELILPTLGYKVLQPVINNRVDDSTNNCANEILQIKSKDMIVARGKVVDDGFVVLKNSMLSYSDLSKIKSSTANGAVNALNKCVADGSIVENIFVKDTLFSNPSYAAQVILGYRCSGPQNWKNSAGTTLKQLLENGII